MKSNLNNDDLIHLIQNLTKAEKRYFKLTQKATSDKDKDYLKLFDYLLKQESYNPTLIKAHFKNETFIKRLPEVKLYLYNSILKSLRPLYRNQSVSQQIQNLINDTELLYKKGLYKQCIILLDRAKKLADDNEINYLRLQILRYQRQYAVEHFKHMKVYSPDKIRAEEMKIIKQMEMININEGLANSLHSMLFKEGSIRTQEELNKVQEIHKIAAKYEKESKISFRSEFLNLYLNGDTHFIIGNYSKAIEYGKRQISIWEENPQQLKKDPTDYIKSFNTLFQRSLRCGRNDVFKDNISRLENFLISIKKLNSIPYNVLGFIRISSNYLYYYTKTGQFNEAIVYYNSIDAEMKKYAEYMEEGTLIEQQFLIAYAHYGNGDIKNGKIWLNKILNQSHLTLKNDLQVVCRIFEIIIYLDLDDIDVVENRIPRLYRFLKGLDRLYSFEQAILNCLQLLVELKVNLSQAIFEEKFNKELKIVKQGTINYSAFDYFDVYSCLVSQKEQNPLSKIVTLK